MKQKETPMAELNSVINLTKGKNQHRRSIDGQRIILKDYSIQMYLGLHGFEQEQQQRVFVSVELETADPEEFWNYDQLVEFFENTLKGSRISTQEKLCESIIEFVEDGPLLNFLRVQTKKPDVFRQAIYVSLERSISYNGSTT